MVDVKEGIYKGFRRLDFRFEGRNAILVLPETPINGNKWLYKTEYFEAFQDFEMEMVSKGYFLAHLENKSRWCPKEDTEIRDRFCSFLIKEYNLNPKCVLVGLSCGGMQAVYFAAAYPKYVAAMYLDAPVLNLLSCPYALGKAQTNFIEEFEKDMSTDLSQLINYRNHPIDHKEELLNGNVPVFMVGGDSDKTVPYDENGALLTDFYRKNGGVIFEMVKENCDHHPHGLSDNTPIIEFVEKYYR